MAIDQKHLEAAEGYLELGLPLPALEALSRVSLEGRRESAFEYFSLTGDAYRTLARYDEAISTYEQAQQERPDSIPIYLHLGWCFKRIARLDRAIASLEQGVKTLEKSMKSDDLGAGSMLSLLLYNLACYYSLDRQKEPMLDRLRAALALEESFRNSIADETDFDPFRDDPDFIQLVSQIV